MLLISPKRTQTQHTVLWNVTSHFCFGHWVKTFELEKTHFRCSTQIKFAKKESSTPKVFFSFSFKFVNFTSLPQKASAWDKIQNENFICCCCFLEVVTQRPKCEFFSTKTLSLWLCTVFSLVSENLLGFIFFLGILVVLDPFSSLGPFLSNKEAFLDKVSHVFCVQFFPQFIKIYLPYFFAAFLLGSVCVYFFFGWGKTSSNSNKYLSHFVTM